MNARLECAGLRGGWGAVTVVRDVDLAVQPGTMHAILGPNGAGKTTLLLTLAGLLPAHAGSLAVDGVPLRTGKPTAAARAGVVLVPDNRALFTTLSVEENLRVPARRDEATLASMLELFPALAERRKIRAGALSGGEQQMLTMARALIQQPKVLLVDELSMGLAPVVVQRLFTTMRHVATGHGCAVVFVEQYANLALEFADTASILYRGRVALEGNASDIAAQPQRLEQAYLGALDEEIVQQGGTHDG
jgi:branched-chain amino acid transport system ATP-binding protein